MFFSSFSYIYFLVYALFFFFDVCTGLHFFDFVELGILFVVSCIYFVIVYCNVISRAIWFISYTHVYGFHSLSFSNNLSMFSFGNTFGGSFGYNHFYLSVYHYLFCCVYYRYAALSVFSYSSFFFSDGIDFLYSSYRISTLWLFCVFMFCCFFVFSTFSPVFSANTRFSFSSLKSHFVLEFNAFFSVVFYVIGLFCFCLLGLSVWFSLFFDSYGVVREVYGCQ